MTASRGCPLGFLQNYTLIFNGKGSRRVFHCPLIFSPEAGQPATHRPSPIVPHRRPGRSTHRPSSPTSQPVRRPSAARPPQTLKALKALKALFQAHPAPTRLHFGNPGLARMGIAYPSLPGGRQPTGMNPKAGSPAPTGDALSPSKSRLSSPASAVSAPLSETLTTLFTNCSQHTYAENSDFG